MSAVDFEEWAAPDLQFDNIGGRTYVVRPPSVGEMPKVLAAAVLGEQKLGKLVGVEPGPIPEPIQAVLDTIGPNDHPALGATHAQMIADGVDPVTLDRVGYYAVFYWARGKEFADAVARGLWSPRDAVPDVPATGGGAARKVRRRPKSGRRGA